MMYQSPMEKEFSPSFWESEDRSQGDWKGFEGIIPGIEHALGRMNSICLCLKLTLEAGRLLYTTGDVEGAVKLFLGLLRGTSSGLSSLSLRGPIMGQNGAVPIPTQETQVNLDKIFLEDFRVAFKVG